MKTEDLMIGDWVLFAGSKYQIHKEDFSANYDFEPIPLTSEILEKNGFAPTEDPYNHKKYFLLGKNEYNCDVYWDGSTILFVEEDYEPTIYAYICDVKYVHKLQHILKDLEIEKEIVL